MMMKLLFNRCCDEVMLARSVFSPVFICEKVFEGEVSVLKRERGSNIIGFKSILGLSMALMMSLGFETDVFAEEVRNSHDISVNVSGNGLHLELSGVEDFGVIQLKKTPVTHATSFKGELTVTDLRGNGKGWELYATATPFVNVTDGEHVGHELPAGSFKINPVEKVAYAGEGDMSNIKEPLVFLDEPTVLDDGVVEVVKTFMGSGAGAWGIYFPKKALEITVDATTAYEGEYESTIHWFLSPTGLDAHDVD